jgi:hypothetical protein
MNFRRATGLHSKDVHTAAVVRYELPKSLP